MIGTPWWTSATCIVCGVETENRCSDCAAHGTEWIYFCSIKHKKLVYPLHKRVCGIRSKPFQWPGLSREEINLYVGMGVKPWNNGSAESHSWIKNADSKLEGEERKEEFRERIKFYLDPGRGTALSAELAVANIELRIVAAMNAHNVACGAATLFDWDRFPEVLSSQPIDYVASIFDSCDPMFLRQADQFAPWANQLHHRYFILTAIAIAAMQDPSYENVECFGHVSVEISRFIAYHNITRSHETLAKRLHASVDQLMRISTDP